MKNSRRKIGKESVNFIKTVQWRLQSAAAPLPGRERAGSVCFTPRGRRAGSPATATEEMQGKAADHRRRGKLSLLVVGRMTYVVKPKESIKTPELIILIS